MQRSDDEVARMATELSTILGHVDRMSEIELEGVPPTTHVVEVTGALRADEPRPSWPRETMLEQAPAEKDGGFLVPSPQAE